MTKKPTKRDLAPVTEEFRSALAKLAPNKDLRDIQWTRLKAHTDVHDSPRHFGRALVERDGPLILVAPELAKQPVSVIRGVIYHELGHLVVLLGYAPSVVGYDAAERQADEIAEALFGCKMYYNKNKVQCCGRGARGVRPRPRGLR